MASANSFITDWDAKFTYNFWRPVTAIRNGDQDGNDATERDAGWSPLAPTPMHPEYPSQASISAGVLARNSRSRLGQGPGRLLHRDRHRRPEADEDGESALRQWLKSIRNVRVWGGIHFRNSLNVAQNMGSRIADYLVESTIKPVR